MPKPEPVHQHLIDLARFRLGTASLVRSDPSFRLQETVLSLSVFCSLLPISIFASQDNLPFVDFTRHQSSKMAMFDGGAGYLMSAMSRTRRQPPPHPLGDDFPGFPYGAATPRASEGEMGSPGWEGCQVKVRPPNGRTVYLSGDAVQGTVLVGRKPEGVPQDAQGTLDIKLYFECVPSSSQSSAELKSAGWADPARSTTTTNGRSLRPRRCPRPAKR